MRNSAGKTEAAFESLLLHCLETPNANVLWLAGSIDSFAQALKALEVFGFTPGEITNNKFVCELLMVDGCAAAGTKAKVTVKLTSAADDKLGSVPSLVVKL